MQTPKQILMTAVGLENLKKEKEELEKKRPAAVEDLRKAREMGDLSENGYYKSARAKLSSIDARFRHLTYIIRFAKVHKGAAEGIVDIGISVILETEGKEVVYTLVGEHEADPSEKKISHLSPLGKALIGKKVSQSVTLTTPNGLKSFTIKKIS